MILEICNFLIKMKEDFDNDKTGFIDQKNENTIQVLVDSLFSSNKFYHYIADINLIKLIEHIRINEYYVRTGSIIDIYLKNKLHFLLIGSPENYLNVMINKENVNGQVEFLFTYEYETLEITKINNNFEDVFVDNKIKTIYDINEEIEFYFKLKGII